jgi:alpha-mannosidase
MLPRTPFQQFAGPRIAGSLKRLKREIWHVDTTPLPVSAAASTKAHHPAAAALALDYAAVEPHTHWGRKYEQRFWKIDLPEAADGKHYLSWQDQAEATMYVPDGDGLRAIGGADPGHDFVLIPAGTTTIHVESCCMRTGIWVPDAKQGITPRGSHFAGAFLATRDDAAWHAYFDLEVLADLAGMLHRTQVRGEVEPQAFPNDDLFNPGGYRTPIEEAPPLLRVILDRLDRAIDVLESDGPAAFHEAAQAIYKELPAGPHEIEGVLTGHGHIDLVWLWPESTGDFKAVHTFSNILAIQEQYPEMIFGYTQPASYQAVAARSPEVIERVKKRVGEGTWEPTGAMWVESDNQLPCGEALVRAVALGQAGLAEYRQNSPQGPDSKVLWLPDVFGYSACLPQILVGFGVPYFFTTKIFWSGATRFPYSSFIWRGVDGSEIVSHINWIAYNNRATPSEGHHFSVNHRQAHIHNETLMPTGYGDGGGGVTAEMCERARRQSDLAGVPKLKWGRIEDFFDRLAEHEPNLPTWHGEMYLEYHRGVQTTHGDMKAAYRAAERGLQVHEAAHVVTGRGPIDDAGWKRVCFHQFHDDLPGSSIHEVYDEVVPELEGIAADALIKAKQELGGNGDALFNPLPVPTVARHGDRFVELPPLTATGDFQAVPATSVEASAKRLSNNRIVADFDAAGRVTALSVGGEPIALTAPAGLFVMPDHEERYPAWDINRATLSNSTALVEPTGSAVDDADPLVPRVSFTYQTPGGSEVKLSYILDAAADVLRVEIETDWTEPMTLLKFAVPTAYSGKDALFGGPFGATPRPNWSGTIESDARFEVPASRWAVARDDGGAGAMLVTEAKYGFGCHEGLLHLSLLRSAKLTQALDDRAIRDVPEGDAGTYSDLKRHHIRFALGRFDPAADRAAQPATLCDTLYTPPLTVSHIGSAGLLGLDGLPSVHATWAKPVEGGFVLRLNETQGRRGTLKLRLADGCRAERVDLRDEPAGAIDGEIEVTPFALISVRLTRS